VAHEIIVLSLTVMCFFFTPDGFIEKYYLREMVERAELERKPKFCPLEEVNVSRVRGSGSSSAETMLTC